MGTEFPTERTSGGAEVGESLGKPPEERSWLGRGELGDGRGEEGEDGGWVGSREGGALLPPPNCQG